MRFFFKHCDYRNWKIFGLFSNFAPKVYNVWKKCLPHSVRKISKMSHWVITKICMSVDNFVHFPSIDFHYVLQNRDRTVWWTTSQEKAMFVRRPMHWIDWRIVDWMGVKLCPRLTSKKPSPDHMAKKVHIVDTDGRVVFDAQIDVFLDTESKVGVLTEVFVAQFVFTDLKKIRKRKWYRKCTLLQKSTNCQKIFLNWNQIFGKKSRDDI